MKIFYWSPFISKVATVSSVIRSAESILKYSKKENNINVAIIDAIGEWKNYRKIINPKIEIINLSKKNISESLPKVGFFKSRLSYVLIFTLTFFKLLNLINKEKPDYIIAHLLTSLPIFLTLIIFFVLEAAINRSVCRQRKAGICKISTCFATIEHCSTL